ncbi:putative monooxygenase [Serpula lacrymans var. lacrymans S7.9]|uniref:Putative monooxygenase n=1 Tax=Serpula lacrymans var. lacrymans (strain S7.9) TaxID=578457 RepID=F8P5I7_SERL9|nr:putative monooxygenase [Serpula lacrymans var. lacrymans S7.9]EGO21874.1 putative monooxygenase [Serpula lacrymans var. lacrymans S7.9]
MSFDAQAPTGPSVVIIGAGVGGLGFAIALKKQLGCHNITIYEKANDVGGTWRDNTYPGCSSDVAVHYYSLSTDLNPRWKGSHGSQPELHAYLKDLTNKHSLRDNIEFNSKFISADWDSARQSYDLVIEDVLTGVTRAASANILISAVGVLAIPKYPTTLPGLSTFKGNAFHSARWDHTVDFRGKRVAVIGNGCSAISVDPSVQLVNFTATPYSECSKWIFAHVPGVMRLYRNTLMAMYDSRYLLFVSTWARRKFTEFLKRFMLDAAPAEIHDKIIPNYELGSKRLIVERGDGYLASFRRPNVNMNSDGIAEVTENGILTQKGEHMPFDVIIYATGFDTDKFSYPVRGLKGQSMEEFYDSQGGPTAYLGTTFPGFPNFYALTGPNTCNGHTSVIFLEECQISYCLQLIKPVVQGLASSFAIKMKPTLAYDSWVQRRLSCSLFTQCFSWYRREGSKKISTIFPGPLTLFWWLTRSPQWEHYEVEGGEKWEKQRRMARISRAVGCISLIVFSNWALSPREMIPNTLSRFGTQLLKFPRVPLGTFFQGFA